MKITKIILNQPFHEINLKDSFFDSLRNSYSEFNEWFKKKAEEGRKANYVFYSDDKIIAFLSLKIEDKILLIYMILMVLNKELSV